MGCNESKQRAPQHATDDYASDWPLASTNIGSEYAADGSSMGQPGSMPQQQQWGQGSSSQAVSVAGQHERLMLELFGFKDAGQFRDWIRSPRVHGSWLEFRRDSERALPLPPARGGIVAEIDKAKAAQLAKDAVKNKTPKYLLHYPEKRDWTLDDHIVRFIAVVISDNLLGGLWSMGDWNSRSLDIAKSVYEALVYLRSTEPTEPAADLGPPGYSD